ncbi:complement receptor type 1-like isoform X2 [Rhinoderma darwinii]|uniref:complement receptor type 1-like isoform X2 n=1 Tax=Rhinoderma darwinii TaxID=43563 RepID=UPI003F674701
MMQLLGIRISSCSTLLFLLFLANFTTRSHAQAARDFMDMDIDSSTLGPPQEDTTPCKGDIGCEEQTQQFDTTDIGFTAQAATDFMDMESSTLSTSQEAVAPCKGDTDCAERTQQFDANIGSTGFCSSPPYVPFAKLSEDFLEQTVFPIGATISYKCQTGYLHAAGTKATVTCLNNGTWSYPHTFCNRKSCGNPGDVHHGQMQAENFDFGSRVSYVCNIGYIMTSKRNYRDCQANGQWSNVLPECTVLSCASPPVIENGRYYPEKEDYTYLDSVSYKCNGNLALIGEQNIACTEEGKWSSNAPECKVVVCPNPNVDNALKTSGVTGPYNLNYIVRFRCWPHHKLIGSDTVTCNQNSKWEPELPKCLGICRSAPHFTFAELVDPTANINLLEGTTLEYKCKLGYEPVPGAVNTVTCLKLQKWSSPLKFCKLITCVEPEIVPHGRIISGLYSFGSRITYACETGYKMKRFNFRTCLSDRSWSLPIPECEAQTCATPEYVKNGWYGPEMEEYIYNDTITYDCNEGFQLVGQASITCLHDGRWNYQSPGCRGICNAPPGLDFAQLAFQFQAMVTFLAGTTVQYICRPGFYRDYSFTNTITCLGNFTWSKTSNEFCKIYRCPTPGNIKNGWYSPQMEAYLHNDTITYDCNEGFQLAGQASITCLHDGRWNVNAPECRGICDDPPDLHYAQLDFRFKHITTFFVGNVVQYACRPGYIQNNMVHSNTITCLGNLAWSKIHTEFCNRTSCGRPAKVANAVFEANNFLFESEAIYKCEKGYKMVSPSQSVKCGSNTRWNGSLPVCEVQKCLPPEDLKDGSYSLKKEDYIYNESVIYKCNTLQLVGKASVSCTEEGKWSSGAPECKAVCTFPPGLDYAVVEEEFAHQKFFNSGKSVQYKCHPGFVPVTGKSNKITCLTDLKWSQHELFCTRISCGDPGDIDHGQIQSENFLFGSRINYTCFPGYSMISKRNYRECQADGTWSAKAPVCKELVCDQIWELQEEARKCTSAPDEWMKYLQVQYLYLQIENLKLDIEIKKRQLDVGFQPRKQKNQED